MRFRADCFPTALGATVPLALSSLAPSLLPSWSPLAKTKFSMVLPEVEQSLKEWGTKSVVLFGIEVRLRVGQGERAEALKADGFATGVFDHRVMSVCFRLLWTCSSV